MSVHIIDHEQCLRDHEVFVEDSFDIWEDPGEGFGMLLFLAGPALIATATLLFIIHYRKDFPLNHRPLVAEVIFAFGMIMGGSVLPLGIVNGLPCGYHLLRVPFVTAAALYLCHALLYFITHVIAAESRVLPTTSAEQQASETKLLKEAANSSGDLLSHSSDDDEDILKNAATGGGADHKERMRRWFLKNHRKLNSTTFRVMFFMIPLTIVTIANMCLMWIDNAPCGGWSYGFTKINTYEQCSGYSLINFYFALVAGLDAVGVLFLVYVMKRVLPKQVTKQDPTGIKKDALWMVLNGCLGALAALVASPLDPPNWMEAIVRVVPFYGFALIHTYYAVGYRNKYARRRKERLVFNTNSVVSRGREEEDLPDPYEEPVLKRDSLRADSVVDNAADAKVTMTKAKARFRQMMRNKEQRADYWEFLKKEWADENMQFLVELRDYRRKITSSPDNRLKLFNGMISKFFDEKADMWLNLPAAMMKDILKAADGSGEIQVETHFDKAEGHIEHMLMSDSFLRWLARRKKVREEEMEKV